MKKANLRKGFFISIEKTVEGIGGTTQAVRLVDELQKLGYDAVYTREPGGTEFGKEIRELVLTPIPDGTQLSSAAELFLFMADRAQHYKEVLKPALAEGKVVVCDRYIDSTLAYQGAGRGWSKSLLLRLHQAATGALMPDFTVVLDGATHRENPNDDRFEALDNSFHQKVRERMLQLAEGSQRYFVLSTIGMSKDDVTRRLMVELGTRLTGRSQ